MKVPYLENNRVSLSLLDLNNYHYIQDISKQNKLIQYSPNKIDTPIDLKNYVQVAVAACKDKSAIPLLIFDKHMKAYAGSTRFGLINWHNKVLHIGWTWIGKEFQGTGLNKSIKYLMLQHAFETLKFDKVEFRIDERNIISRKAVENIGGVFEGLLRKNTLMLDGFKRSTCCYGILKEEWHAIKNSIFANYI